MSSPRSRNVSLKMGVTRTWADEYVTRTHTRVLPVLRQVAIRSPSLTPPACGHTGCTLSANRDRYSHTMMVLRTILVPSYCLITFLPTEAAAIHVQNRTGDETGQRRG